MSKAGAHQFSLVQALCVLLGCSGAGAQTTPQAPPPPPPGSTIPSVRPDPTDLAPKPAPTATDVGNLPRAPSAPPPRELGKPDEDIVLDVKGYTVAPDAPDALRQALPALTAAYVGPGRHYEDLANAAAEVTRFLQRDLGYYLGYAYLPEQDSTDGTVRIAVLEGRLDKIVLNWSDDIPVRKEIVEGYLARLKPGSILQVRDVERVVFLLNDLRGMTAKFEVQAGSIPGTASLVVTPTAEKRWSGKVDFDVNGSRFLGVERLGGLVSYNSPLGRGDALTLNALTSANSGLRFLLAGYTLPLGTDGWKIGGSVSFVDYKLSGDQFSQGFDVHGTASNLTAYVLYPAIRSRNLNLFTLGAVEVKRYKDTEGLSTTDKKVNSLTLGATGDFRDNLLRGGVSTYDLNLAIGQIDYVTPRPAALDDAKTYRKLGFAFNRLQSVVEGRLLGYVALRGQYAFDNLDTSEQFRLGGPDGLRAYAVGEGTGDTGAMVSLELRLLPPEAWFGHVSREMAFSVFYDAGSIRYRHDASTQGSAFDNRATYTDAGIGVAWVRPGEYALRVSLASPLSGNPKSDKQVKNPRLYAQFTKFF